MKSLISFIALIRLVFADPTMISNNGYLNPGRITWWKEKWALNSIELSQTNSGTYGVYVNVNFRPSTTVNSANNLEIVQLIVPSTFSTTTIYTSNTMTIIGATDMTASFQLAAPLPSAGVYGPFQLITRSSSIGKIYDTNFVFGCVVVSASVIISGSSLATTAATLTSTTGIVGSKDALIFWFAVPSGVNLWKHDIIEIIPDSRWTVTASPTCQSVDITSVTNYIKGPNNDNNLPCALAATGGANGGFNTATSTDDPATNSIYIYGLSQEVINNSGYQVKLQVSSFTFPGYCISSSSYSWTVKIWRWGTTNLLAGFFGSGPLTPIPGTITVSSWAPFNTNIAQTDIPHSNNFSIFTKLTFRLSHTVSIGGKVDITFSNASPSIGAWWQDIADISTQVTGMCFLNNYITGVRCSVSGNVATISVTGKTATLDPSKDISITLLSTLSPGAKISTIFSSDGSYNNIDAFTFGLPWTFSTMPLSSYASLTQFTFAASDASTYYLNTGFATDLQVGGDISKYLVWMVQPSNVWTSNTVLEVYLPLTSSWISLHQTYISSSAQYVDGVQADSTSDLILSAAATATASVYSSGSIGTLSIAFTSGIAAGSYFGFGYGDGSSKAALPYVKSNVGTFYECWTKAYTSSSASSPVEFSSYVFSVYSSLADSSLTAKPVCKDELDGIPILVNYHANLIDFNFGDSTYKYMLDIVFTITATSSTNLGTGIADGNALPIATSSSVLTPTATITSNIVTISGTGTISADDSAVIFIPNGSTSPTRINAALTFYYVLTSGDPTIKYQLYTGSSSTTTLNTVLNSIIISAWTSPSNGAYTVGETSVTTSGTTTLEFSLSIATGDYFGVGLPSGFTASSPWVVLGDISTTVYSVTSSNSFFAGGFIVGIANSASSSAILTTTGALSYSFGGINAALSSLSTSAAFSTPDLIVFVATGSGASCNTAGSLPVTISAATITNDGCSIDKAFTNGADSVDSTLTLTFTIVNNIPGNGKITITLGLGEWTLSSSAVATTCSGVGFTDYDAKNSIMSACNISGATVTLAGFSQVAAGIVTVNIYHIIPAYVSTTALTPPCFTDVSTYDAAGNYIDTASSLTNNLLLLPSSTAGTTTSELVANAYPNTPETAADTYLNFIY